jgi:transcriptional regulator with XRE-family HTH domain
MSNSGLNSDYIKERIYFDKDGEFTRAYLKKGFLAAAMEALFYARREAGLTQAQLADRLQTKHSSIARWEADTSGSISLHRYIEMALACGMIPLNIKLVPISSLSEYATEDPQAPRTADHYDAWLKKKFD